MSERREDRPVAVPCQQVGTCLGSLAGGSSHFRAACHYFFSEWEEVVDDCTKALELDPSYGKVVGRRANA